jgi:transcription antitermination factor NusG
MSFLAWTAISVRYEVLLKSGLDETNQFQWYAAYTYPRHEKKVLDQLLRREIGSFLPSYRAFRKWRNGCKVEVQLPIFPGYVFVKIPLREQLRVLQVPSVVSLVSFGGVPAPLPAEVIETLKATLSTIHAEPHPFVTVGDRVRIISGCLAGVEGIFLRKASGCRFVLNVDLIMQAVSLEVNAEDVEPIPPSFHASSTLVQNAVGCPLIPRSHRSNE